MVLLSKIHQICQELIKKKPDGLPELTGRVATMMTNSIQTIFL